MKIILVATHGTTLTIAGLTAMFGTPENLWIGGVSKAGTELTPEHIDLVMADVAEIVASPQYKLWAVRPAPKAKATQARGPKLAPTTSTSSLPPTKATKRIRNRKPRVASTEPSVNGAEANAGAPPRSLTMADQEKAVLEDGGSLSETETPGPRPVKTRVRHRKPPKPRPVVVEEPEAVNS